MWYSATLSLRGIRDGTTRLKVTVNRMKDDSGAVYTTTASDGTIRVGSGVGKASETPIPEGPVPGTTPATPAPASLPTPDQEAPGQSGYILIPTTTPAPAEGGITIDSSPQGAEIFLDGQAAGTTPLLLEHVPAGDHTLSLSKEGFIDLVYGVVKVRAGELTRITDIRLTPVSTIGTVTIDSAPRGAEIRLDGEYYGATPLMVSLDEGVYPLEITCPGYTPYTGEVRVVANEARRPAAIVLTPLPRYTVSIVTTGEGEVTPEGDVQVVEGGNLTMVIAPATGNQLSEVLVDGGSAGPVSEYTLHDVRTNHRVEVRFVPIPIAEEPDKEIPEIPEEPDEPLTIPVEFTSNISSGFAPLTVAFNATGGADVRAWNWQFGDSSVSTGQTVIHTYQEPGNFTVSLTVSNGKGVNRECESVTIAVYPPLPVVSVNFSANITEGSVPLAVRFSDLSSGADRWLWEFGDGENSTAQNPVHVFTEPGS